MITIDIVGQAAVPKSLLCKGYGRLVSQWLVRSFIVIDPCPGLWQGIDLFDARKREGILDFLAVALVEAFYKDALRYVFPGVSNTKLFLYRLQKIFA